MNTITEEKKDSKLDELLSKPYKLILHNDDYNTFEWVIQSLIEVCKHDHTQAEQAAHIVHFNGKCDVKWGDYETLNIMKEKLKSRGLSVTMEKN